MAIPRLKSRAPFFARLLALLALSAPPARANNAADAALDHTFTLQGVTATQPLRADAAGYDWDWRGPRDDPEWAWFFNRHGWFPALLAAYQETGDARYRDALLDTLDDWILTHPAPSRISFSSAWRPLEAARRLLHSWLPLAENLSALDGFTPERAARFRASLVDHGDHLMARHAFGGNHLVTEMLALVRLALAAPDLPGAERWLAYALDTLHRAYEHQVYPDGAHTELSTHYQRVIALNYQELLDLLRRHGKTALAEQWAPRSELLWRYVAEVMTPSGGNPLNNDSDREHYRHLLSLHAPALLDEPPATTHFPWAGQTVFRGGPEQSHWAFFEAGPRGTDHDHADHLQLNLSLGDAAFLVDNGRYTYQPGPWREFFAGPGGHNVVLLDGRGSDAQARRVSAAPIPKRFRREGGLEIAWGDAVFSTPANARAGDWRRVVVHAPGAGWVVIDRVVAFGARELTTLWHWSPESEPMLEGGALVVRNNETVLSVEPPAGGAWHFWRGAEKPRPRGWFSPRLNHREPAPQTDYVQTLRGPVVNVWVFRVEGVENDVLSAEALENGRVRIRWADTEATLDRTTMVGK